MTTSSPDPASFAFEQLRPSARAAPAPAVAAPDASEILAAARAEADLIRAEARDEGFRAGMAEAGETLRPSASALEAAVSALEQERAASGERLEEQAVELALAIAEKAVQAAVDVQPERVLDVIRGAMRLLVEREDVVVYVNPLDVDVIRDALESLSEGAGRIEVVEERRVARGGAVLRTSVGEIDATLETKLERAAQVVRAELGS